MHSEVKSVRYAVLASNRHKQRKIRTNLTPKRDQKYFHFDLELESLELDLRNSKDQSRTRSAGEVVSVVPDKRET